jgi:hypothetical protein
VPTVHSCVCSLPGLPLKEPRLFLNSFRPSAPAEDLVTIFDNVDAVQGAGPEENASTSAGWLKELDRVAIDPHSQSIRVTAARFASQPGHVEPPHGHCLHQQKVSRADAEAAPRNRTCC